MDDGQLTMDKPLGFEHLVDLFEQTNRELRKRAARSVDLALVVRNWLFGWYIVEFEQEGIDRAQYGDLLIRKLSEALKNKGLRGVSATSLKQFRSFYLCRKAIGQTVSDLSLFVSQKGQTAPDISQVPREQLPDLRRSRSLSLWPDRFALNTKG